jgi:hypothetical protein
MMKLSLSLVLPLSLFAISAFDGAAHAAGNIIDCRVVKTSENSPLDEGLSTADEDYAQVYVQASGREAKLGGFYVSKSDGDTIRLLARTAKLTQVLLMRREWGADQYVVSVERDRPSSRNRVWGSVSYKESGRGRAVRIATLVCK